MSGYRRLLTSSTRATMPRSPISCVVMTQRQYSSPVKVFIKTIKEQLQKNKEMQDGVKTLQDESGRLADSEALKKAKEMFAKAKAQQTEGQKRLKEATEKFSETAGRVGAQVNEQWKKAADTEFVKETSENIKKAAESINKQAEPLKNSEVAGKISESFRTVVKDESGRYTGFVDKETRRKMREQAQQGEAAAGSKRVQENPEAGANIVIHKDSKWKESWNKFKEDSPIMQGIFRARRNYEESDNIFVSYTRAFTDRVSETVGSIFEESDQAQAIRVFQTIDPTFNMEKFMKEARSYIIPELMEAYLKGDVETLKLWCSEATYNVLTAVIQAQMQQGLISDCKIQDLRDVDLVAAKILENDVPVLVLSFRTQEIILFRNAKSGEVAYGKEDHIEQVTYACVLTKEPEDLQNPVTAGWRIIDMAKHDSRPVW
ncbi:TIM44 subunit of mitochondria import inner membrane translocase [Hesseltinella vesiculosa]|uniref:Mitochondrial import inner membrane translocase subunit TIM44 n=1 Tax=Hesseltinella vesiculosa TaxID=101127 RepID=A0A1X2GT94_9FUNG|nr:TIM44 subunit of mitochondria import inner membrane translocase [Hesseltinella vesiculosa]